MKIIGSVQNSPKSAKQISEECNIPRSTVYKKLKILQDKNLIQTKGILQNGVKNRIYKNIIDVKLNEQIHNYMSNM
jgi:predicted transcriptional regulator